MGFLDLFKATENEKLKNEIIKLNKLLTPEHLEAKRLMDLIEGLEDEVYRLEECLLQGNTTLENLNTEIQLKKETLIILDEEILMQEFGLYKPNYDFATSEQYKDRLNEIRQKQKDMIKGNNATNYSTNWTVDGSLAKGKKMTNDNIKQILRTFNIECENAIDRVKFNNVNSMQKRIEKSFESLNKLNKTVLVSIKKEYLELKIEELYLAYEYQIKKQDEKEEAKRIREELKEQAKLQKELAEAKANISKDLKHFNNALGSVLRQLEDSKLTDEKKEILLEKKAELQCQVTELEANLKDVDYRQNNQRAGYVYIISNIGSFGENIYKIGMTRRLDPQERVDELGDASVPFNFDVHAMIFTEDAPALENALHKAFENKKVNMINSRREFFNVSLEEIEEVVKANFDKTVDFIKIPPAEQYRESLKMLQN